MEIISNSLKEIKIDNKEVRLNPFILSLVSKYIIKQETRYKIIFEISLLSKSTFKLFQNQIIISSNSKTPFILKTFITFKKYICLNDCGGGSGSEIIDKYKLKLVQYKEIEEITFTTYSKSRPRYPLNQIKRIKRYGGEEKEEDYNDNNRETKKYMSKHCPLLKRVIILNRLPICQTGDIDRMWDRYDFTCSGFYQFNKLLLNWDLDTIPLSSNEEYNIDQVRIFGIYNHTFSFSFLKCFNPIKLYISNFCMSDAILHLKNVQNILHVGKPSINTIKFIRNCTSYNFIEQVIQSNNPIIKSFTVEIFIQEGGNDDNDNELIESLKNGNLNTNNTLKSLVINRYSVETDFELYGKFKSLNPDKIIQLLQLNSSITKIGLNAYNIKDSNLLLPLIKLPYISTLVCDSNSLKSHLEHCNQNKNIKHLIIINLLNGRTEIDPLIIQDQLSTFNYFLNNNTSSLISITHTDNLLHKTYQNFNYINTFLEIYQTSKSNLQIKNIFKLNKYSN